MNQDNSQKLLSLANILIVGGVIFATLFFLGYWHLSWYFGQFGTLIPFYELQPTLIAQIGFFQFITIGIPLLLLSLFLKQYYKNKIFILGTATIFLLISLILSQLLANYNKPFNSTWLSFIFGDSVPNVEIAYKVPLANNELLLGSSFENISNKIKNEDVKLHDKSFNDDSGNEHYIAQFKLYFESKDNYYLKSNASFCELYGLLAKEAIIKEKELDLQDNIIKIDSPLILSTKPDFTISLKDISPEVLKSITENEFIVGNSIQYPYTFNFNDTYIINPLDNNISPSEEQKEYENKRQCKLIILPKVQVESLKYYK